MRRVEQLMGMPVSIDIPGADGHEPFDAAFGRLQAIDIRFSPYKSDSELCKYQRGELKEAGLSSEMKQIMKACAAAEKMTNGYFSAHFSGVFDPTGYVKGWAIAQAGREIAMLGFKTYCIGAGGDILARSGSDKVWNIGLQDPQRPKYLTSKVSGKNLAVATSGNYERGKHIINPKTGEPANELLSLTVTGPNIIKADVLATAAFAMGPKALDFINQQAGYEALAVGRKGDILLSAKMQQFLA